MPIMNPLTILFIYFHNLFKHRSVPLSRVNILHVVVAVKVYGYDVYASNIRPRN